MKTLQGTISSLKRTNTATVVVEHLWRHPLYQKSVKRSKKYACHYENMTLEVGDSVEIRETRPMSKTKHFVIVEKKAK